jgi:type VI secretion system secreted protein Hcp
MSPHEGPARFRWLRIGLPAALLALALTGVVILAGGVGTPPSAAQSAPTDFSSALTGYVGFFGPDGELTIPGESAARGHEEWIDLISFNQGVQAATTAGAGGVRRGRTEFEDIIIIKHLDKASPLLQRAAVVGSVIPLVVIELAKSGPEQQVFYRYELRDVQVKRYNIGSTGQKEISDLGQPRVEVGGPGLSEIPFEEIALGFGKILVQYRVQRPDGSLGEAVEFSWDVVANSP